MGRHQAEKHTNPGALNAKVNRDRSAKSTRNTAVESTRKGMGLPPQKAPLPND